MNQRILRVLALLPLFAACARNRDPEPEMVPETPVRVAPPASDVLRAGDCVEAVRRARAKPDLAVDRLAAPRASVPSALQGKSMPAAVKKAKYNEVRVTVIVEPTGKADMSSFKVLKTTHPWLASNFKTAVARWTFDPAELAGCKVPRLWLGAITSGKPPVAK